MRQTHFWKGYIRLKQGNKPVWIKCTRAVADFYGWSSVFPEVEPWLVPVNGRIFRVEHPRMKRAGQHGGKSSRICRSSVGQGYPAGQTNSIRLSRSADLSDYARVAKAVQIPWTWMEGPDFRRVYRERWMEYPT